MWVLEREAREPRGARGPCSGAGEAATSRCLGLGEGRAGERARQGTLSARRQRGPETRSLVPRTQRGPSRERGEPRHSFLSSRGEDAAFPSDHLRAIYCPGAPRRDLPADWRGPPGSQTRSGASLTGTRRQPGGGSAATSRLLHVLLQGRVFLGLFLSLNIYQSTGFMSSLDQNLT